MGDKERTLKVVTDLPLPLGRIGHDLSWSLTSLPCLGLNIEWSVTFHKEVSQWALMFLAALSKPRPALLYSQAYVIGQMISKDGEFLGKPFREGYILVYESVEHNWGRRIF